MKRIMYMLLCAAIPIGAQAQKNILSGRVMAASDSLPLAGASIKVKEQKDVAITGDAGEFTISTVGRSAVLVISLLGYQTREHRWQAGDRHELIIYLQESATVLEEVVVSTGYQEIPRERATGSFTFIGEEVLNRSVSTDIISRLEGVTNGLAFDRSGDGVAGAPPFQLRVRGISTINADQAPLIVVDNFPYEGDIANINPNDVENITVLKDAAAASIWGARAGNGVIVITTKTGRFNQPSRVQFSSKVTIGAKPNLFYNPQFLPSSGFIDVEQELFNRGFYEADEDPLRKRPLSPVVELLIKARDGLISESETAMQIAALKRQDVRNDLEKYFYRNPVSQQYALNFSGGSRSFRYFLSGGFDRNLEEVIGDKFNRTTLTSMNTFRPFKGLEVTAGLAYMQNHSYMNGLEVSTIYPAIGKKIYPYAILADKSGNPLPILKDYRRSYVATAEEEGFLNWQYRPLEEINLSDLTATGTESRINIGANYSILRGLDIDFKLQYQKIKEERRSLRRKETYYTRNMINRYMQEDGSTPFPVGDILNVQRSELKTQSGRIQANYHALFNEKHRLSAIGGTEIRQIHTTGDGFEIYGYDDDLLTSEGRMDYSTRYPINPYGTARIPVPSPSLDDLIDRFVSYYANASYTYDDRYTLSASARWDASNLFGVNTNQKGVPLWSAGGSWHISEETFYDLAWLPNLKLRVTYGYSGNIDRSTTAFPTASYRTDRFTNLQMARIRTAPNPELRWEKVRVVNLGVDFKTSHNRVNGSVEYFLKSGMDLIGDAPLDPTTGYFRGIGAYTYRINYAGTRTEGIDMAVSTRNIVGSFRWQTDFLFSYVQDKVTRYENELPSALSVINGWSSPLKGKPLQGIYTYPWIGLDAETGDPLVMVNGEPGTDYTTFVRDMTVDGLIYHGPKVPPFFGAIRNTFTWKGFSLSANITWKAGYYFRRSSIDYDNLFNNWEGHLDFEDRWQRPGDEKFTDVPSMPEELADNRNQVYLHSAALVEKGDNIRLQDVQFSYQLTKKQWPGLPFRNVRLSLYARNPGLIWRANHAGLDPDRPHAAFPLTQSFSFGLQADF